jgi:phospholipase C
MSAREAIRHVVVLMLENRSYDHMLGFLELDDPNERLEGLTGDEAIPPDPEAPTELVRVSRATTARAYVTDPDAGHQFADVTYQLFGRRTVPTPPTPLNNGFVRNYAEQLGHDGKPVGPDVGRTIMQCLDPSLLPVLSKLARSFVVCDHWFSSLPGPTWPNRFFVHAATSAGLTDTPSSRDVFDSSLFGGPYRMRTIYQNLLDRGHTWKVYFHDGAQAFALRNLHRYADLFQRFEDARPGQSTFLDDAAAGTLPDYAFIEPQYFSLLDAPANDDHPPHDLVEGERLIATVYDALRANEDVWQHCVFVIVWDEHGGFYDHVPPPAAVPPDGIVSATTGFRFDRLGVRVPALLVSPWVGKGKADHTVYDHSSLPATVKWLFGLPDFLTERDRAANTFDRNFLAEPRATTDTPSNLSALVPRVPIPAVAADERDLSDHQQALHALARALAARPSEHDAAIEVDKHMRTFLDEPQAP